MASRLAVAICFYSCFFRRQRSGTGARQAGGQLDRRQRRAVAEGVVTDARQAGGQLDRRQLRAVVQRRCGSFKNSF